MDEIRWYRCPSMHTRFPLPNPAESILFVAAVDVLAALEDNPDGLADAIRNLLAADVPIPDTIPDWMNQ